MEIKKPQYIRKYDFVRYFIRNNDEWFWPTKSLKEYLKQKCLQVSQHNMSDDDEEEYLEDYEFDTYDYKKEVEDLDLSDPKIFEGNLIDSESKKFIKSQFPMCRKIYDFDEFKLSNDEAFTKTMGYLRNDDNFILFQPTFIYKNKALAKPDALIKTNGKYILIETKGTTSVKCSHLIDITYQHIVINECLSQIKTNISQYFLCIIDYRIADKNELGFTLSEFASIVKSGYGSTKSKFQKFSNEWIADRRQNKRAKNKNLLYSSIINNFENNVPETFFNKDGSIKKDWEKFVVNYKKIRDVNEFDKIIDELLNHQINYQPEFKPTNKYKSWFKDNDYWPEIREYYINDLNNDSHQLFSYSGYLVNFSKVYEEYYKLNKTTEELFNDFKIINDTSNTFYNRVTDNEIVNESTQNMFNHLNNKKVYFDFESLNLATRVIDDTLPFMQTVNQVSIIFDHGGGVTKNTLCNNVLFDPLEMDKDKYKQIVDAILPNKDLSVCKLYSYVVYNKSFEKSRLEEMKWIINEEEYTKKIDVIINNACLFDLADFFDPRKDGYICLAKLKGYYSIKKVLPIIKESELEIYESVGCKDYKSELNVHNGNEAQTLSTQRFFHIISDEQWSNIMNDLKKYCENDVRAMVAVEYYVKKMLSKH